MCLINSILSKLSTLLSAPKLNVLSQICKSILTLPNKVTMLDISRYTGKSYRTIQRFFSIKNIPWNRLNTKIFQQFVYNKFDIYLFASDETVEPKVGTDTFGIARFFSNLRKAVISSVAFMTMSVVSVNRNKSFPLATEQVIKSPKVEIASQPAKAKSKNTDAPKKPKGRPKGSKNKPKEVSKDVQYVVLEKLLQLVTTLLIAVLGVLPSSYLLLDGYFGNQHYMRLALKYNLHLISKLKVTAALYFPYDGVCAGKGRKPKYGNKVNAKNINDKYLVSTRQEDGFLYQTYQFHAWSKNYTDALLNIVVIVCKNLETGKGGHCILFSTDLNLSYLNMVDYYSLRFQIEFNFRDAKQYFGLADFKNYKEAQVTNAVNLSFFMCNFAYILIEHFKEHFNLKKVSILDLKAFYRTENIANDALRLKIKQKKTVNFFNMEQIFNIAKKQAVNF